MKKTILTFLMFVTAAAALQAQALSSLLLPYGAESAALAGSTLARPAASFAAMDNASAMSLSDSRFSVGAAYNLWGPESVGSNVADAGAAFRLGDKFALGFGGRLYSSKELAVTNLNGATIDTFTPKDIIGNLALSYKVFDALSIGVATKYISSSIGPDLSGTAFGADVSVSYALGGLYASAALCNLGSGISYGNTSYSMPMIAKAGAAYKWNALTVSGEADYLFDGTFAASAGAEYGIAGIAFLRAGYHYGTQDKGLPSFASAGLGLKFAGVELNAAYLFASEALGGTMTFGLGYSF